MFKSPDNRLSASNSAVVSSTSFLVSMTLHSEARSAQAAVDSLNRAFEEIRGFIIQLAGAVPGLALLPFEEAISPRLSRIEMMLSGKDHLVYLTFSAKCPIPANLDLWGRVRLISDVYDRLAEFGAKFEDRKGITLLLEEARLDQQKEDSERIQAFRK